MIEPLVDTPLSGLVQRKVKQNFDEAEAKLQGLPAKYRQYEAYERMQGRLKEYKKMNIIVFELKSEAVKDRHWKIILKKLHI